jgi:hypothetical protein
MNKIYKVKKETMLVKFMKIINHNRPLIKKAMKNKSSPHIA